MRQILCLINKYLSESEKLQEENLTHNILLHTSA